MRICGIALLLVSSLMSWSQTSPRVASSLPLREGWMIQAACRVDYGGEKISTAGFQSQGWHRATVPTTVLAALVQDKVYPDPDWGMNLRTIPGTVYPIGANFANLPMPQDSPFMGPWWFRKEFVVPAEYRGRTLWLDFLGINYRANIWLNGKQIANSEAVAGAWRSYEFDVTAQALPGRTNVLAVEVYSPLENDRPSPSSTGIPSLPTSSWDYSATWNSGLAEPWPCAIRPSFPRWIRRRWPISRSRLC